MKNDTRNTVRNYPIHYVSAFAFALAVSACAPDDRDNIASGGAQNADVAAQGGKTQTVENGGNTATSHQATGGSIADGGATEDLVQASTGGAVPVVTGGAASVSTGGAVPVSTGGAAPIATGGDSSVSTGGSVSLSTGGAEQSAGGTESVSTGGALAIATGGAASVSTGGVAQVVTGGAASVGTGGSGLASTGGSEQIATGGAMPVSTGGSAAVATGGATQVSSSAPDEPLCFDETGAPVPYDYSVGIMGEYAYELSMSCEVGGYLMPLIMADPDLLTQVNEFVADATDWYRADVLNCKGATTQLDQSSYGLLPVSQSADLSVDDFEASLALFSLVLDRHDGLSDGVSADKKDKIKDRIKSIKGRAVHAAAAGLTKTLTEPDCMPATASGG
jgi:hypothetical protein